MSPPLSCEHCDRTFTKRYSLNRHLHSIHHVAPLKLPRKAILCPMRNCSDTFAYHGPLRSHLKSTHNIQLQGQKLTFTSMKDFFEWKEKEEMKFFVKYVKACGVQRLLDQTEVYRFNCHRTGTYIPEGKGLRKLKSQGSCKIGASCPSTITAHRHPNDSVTCTYCLTHVGHETIKEHGSILSEAETPDQNTVPNPQIIKIIYPSAITDIIAANVPDSTNIVSIVPKLTSTLVQNHDVFNQFKLSDEDQVVLSIILGQNRSDVETLESVRNITKKAFVENLNELISKLRAVEASASLQNMEAPKDMERFLGKLLTNNDENPVLFYEHIAQQADEASAEFGRINFVIMNSLQSLILQSLGNNGVICIDVIYGKCNGSQDYALVALFVLNHCQSWSLCALCMCLQISEESLHVIFKQIRNRTGLIIPKILLGDHEDYINKAWESAMGKCDTYLVCAWHLDKTSQKLLIQSQMDTVRLACSYKLLLNMLERGSEQRFDELAYLIETASPACEQNVEFRNFFRNNYVDKKSECATFFRTDSMNKAASLMEPIHYLLEHVCNCHGENFNLALCIMLSFFRRHSFDGIDLKELEQSVFVDLSANEHQASLLLSKNLVTSVAERQWSVDDVCRKHLIEQEKDGCAYHCNSLCTSCDVCLYSFNCSCINNAICWKICRHVHLLSKQLEEECWQEDILDFVDEENAMGIVENVTSSEDPEADELVDEVLSDLHECSKKIIANAKLLRGKKELEKLKESLVNTLKLSRSLIGQCETTKEQGIQCDVGTEMDCFSVRLKTLSDHDYTAFC